MATDPYAAPKAHVADAPAAPLAGNFIAEGRAMPAGNGWSWITAAWGIFRQQPGIWILVLIIFLVLAFALAFIPLLGNIAMTLLLPVFVGGLMIGCRAIEQGEALEVGHLFAGFREHAGKLVLVGLFSLIALIVVVLIIGLLVGGSMFAFGTAGRSDPGLAATGVLLAVLLGFALGLPIYMAIWFAPALVVFHDFEVVAALKASFFACLKNILTFLVYGVVMFVLAIVASIPILLGWLVLGPVIFASVYTAYRDVFFAR